jgi:hypothetical protein
MAGFKMFGRKKRRKYPVKVDEIGRSARSQCFEMFAEKVPLHEIAEKTGVKVDTVRRYHQQWKKDPGFERRYIFAKTLFKKNAPDRDSNIELFAKGFGIPEDQLEAILSLPHGLRRLMTGKYYSPARAEADHKMHMALELSLLISDHLVTNRGKFEDVYFALKRYMQGFLKYREEKNAEIEDANKLMQMTHAVLAAAMENERKGRIKPDVLSEEERNAIIRSGIEAEKKKIEKYYWYRIGVLMAGRLTPEQAREKMYQDILKKGDLKMAKAMRQFQDKIHPLVKKDQMQESPHQSPPSI